jgi:hypothetical protein
MRLLRPILLHPLRLSVFRDKRRRLHVVRFPIEIRDLIFRPQKIFWRAMAFEAPSHAVWLRMINHRHVIHLAMAAVATDPAIHVRRVIVIHVIRRAMELHPRDRLTGRPAVAHRLQFRVLFLHLGVAIHADLGVGHVRVRRDLDEAVAITAIHPQLRHVQIMRERHRLNRLIADAGIFWRVVILGRADQRTDDDRSADRNLERQPIRPLREKIRHTISAD